MIRVVPLLVIVVIAYNVAALPNPAGLSDPLFSVGLISGANWGVSLGDGLLILGLGLLYVEILKSTTTTNASLADHALSMGLFVVCLVEFLVVQGCGTSIFFLIMSMSALDVVAGFSVTIRSARRDWG